MNDSCEVKTPTPMSASDKLAIRLTPTARRDFERILASSEREWEIKHRDEYRNKIASAFEHVSEFPRLGRIRDDLLRWRAGREHRPRHIFLIGPKSRILQVPSRCVQEPKRDKVRYTCGRTI